MAFCTECGGELPSTQKFCGTCGSPSSPEMVSSSSTPTPESKPGSGPGVIENTEFECPKCGGHRFYPRMMGHESSTGALRPVCVNCDVDAFPSAKGRASLRSYYIFSAVCVVVGVIAVIGTIIGLS